MVANVQAMFSGRDRIPWHKLGNVVAGCLTWESAMEKAGLRWTVSKRALQDCLGHPVTDSFGIFRDDNNVCLGVVGNVYTISQNIDAFKSLDTFLNVSGAHYETAGALGKGERIWASVNLGAAWNLPATDDLWERYLLYTTSHDGNQHREMKYVKTRTVCQNTLAIALSERGNSVKVKHTATADARFDRAIRMVRDVEHTEQGLNDKLSELAKRLVKKETMHEVLARLYPTKEVDKETGKVIEVTTRTKNTLLDVLELFESNDRDRIPEIRGSGYNLLNAVIEHADHFSNVRNTGKQGEQYDSNQLRTINGIWGGSAQRKNEAVEVIMAATQGAPESAYARMLSRHSVAATVAENGGDRPSLLDTIISQ